MAWQDAAADHRAARSIQARLLQELLLGPDQLLIHTRNQGQEHLYRVERPCGRCADDGGIRASGDAADNALSSAPDQVPPVTDHVSGRRRETVAIPSRGLGRRTPA